MIALIDSRRERGSESFLSLEAPEVQMHDFLKQVACCVERAGAQALQLAAGNRGRVWGDGGSAVTAPPGSS